MGQQSRRKAASLPAPSAARADVTKPMRRWRKALSLGSTTSSSSTERYTDLGELDMDAMTAGGALIFDAHSGAYSGWVYVSTTSSNASTSLRFVKRFCLLQELVCKLYASADVTHERPVARHVVISVARVHTRNKTFAFTDYEDRMVVLHTALGADFECWYGTFAAMVRHTQVAKPRAVSVASRPPFSRVHAFQERSRAFTDGCVTSQAPPSRPEAMPVRVEEYNDPERSHAVWLYLPAPWWRQALSGRAYIRRYVVFSGATVSCFSVNKEGKRATFTRTVANYSYNPQERAGMVELTFSGPHRKLQLRSCSTRGGDDTVVTATNAHTAQEVATYLETALQRC